LYLALGGGFDERRAEPQAAAESGSQQ
jgi:hypothetical protein